MTMTLVLCPHQLFEHEPIELVRKHGIKEVVVWEDPVFFGDRKGSPHGSSRLRLNKMRIIYMRVATKWYIESHLRKHLPADVIKIHHVSVDSLWKQPMKQRYVDLKGKKIWMFDPMDHLFMKRITSALSASNIQIVDTPQFLLHRNEVQEYASNHKGRRLQHAPFFEFMKGKMNTLIDTASMDMMNRQPFPKKAELPPSPFIDVTSVANDANDRAKRWDEQRMWLEDSALFRDNPGSTKDIGYPYTFTEVRAWFHKFLKERFSLFGKYEDAVVPGSSWMYHSGIAIYLNMGLLTPKYVMDAFHEPPFRALKKQLSNYEGFVRQLMGWREYTRYYYEVVPPAVYMRNVFGMKKKKLSQSWYGESCGRSGGTGNSFIDDTIKDAWDTGYLHHIRRLMVMSNYMTLTEIHPDRVFDWMYEFSMDSWDWVMVFNVYSMGTWSDGGYAMRKPYISSSSYLRRMANLKSLDDSYNWDEKFKMFLKKHKEILVHTQLAKLVRSL